MRLEQHHQPLEPAAARRLQRGANLHRVMPVVVNQCHAAHLRFDFKAACHAGEFIERPPHALHRRAQLARHPQCGQSVAHVVQPGQRQPKLPDFLNAGPQGEFALPTFQPDVAGAEIGFSFGRSPVGNHPPMQARDDGAYVGVIRAQDGRTVERHLVQKSDERLLQVFQAGVAVHVLAVDVGHHRDHRRQQQEAAVALVGFHHNQLALAQPGVGAGLVHSPAYHEGGVEPRAGQRAGDERGSSGLAVGAGHRHAVLEPHQFRQHLRARNDRQAAPQRFQHLRILRCHRRGGDHYLRVSQVFCPVPLEHFGAQLLQPRRHRRKPQV